MDLMEQLTIDRVTFPNTGAECLFKALRISLDLLLPWGIDN
jgi:hypothetical protein